MSKYKETIEELFITGYLEDKGSESGWGLIKDLSTQYDKCNDETKAALDKHTLLVLDKIGNAEYRKNIKSIKKNLQFIAWIFIINISAGAIYFYNVMN
tara:strand:- start:105 stop:398 length:294 start_codon:yes stop_codon:yes gene_type:complete